MIVLFWCNMWNIMVKTLINRNEQDEKEWSQHIFVYKYTENQITPMWMSSYIGQDVVKINAKPDFRQKYYLILTDRNGENSNWAWNYWGFELLLQE